MQNAECRTMIVENDGIEAWPASPHPFLHSPICILRSAFDVLTAPSTVRESRSHDQS
jgi:hypothetical protein